MSFTNLGEGTPNVCVQPSPADTQAVCAKSLLTLVYNTRCVCEVRVHRVHNRPTKRERDSTVKRCGCFQLSRKAEYPGT
eukprot:3301688-Rhodomonas_salina.1